MKTKNTLSPAIWILSALITLSPGLAFAQAGSRGGQYLKLAGKLQLRDLVTDEACSWTPGTEMLQNPSPLNTALNGAIQNLTAVDWYLAFDLRRQIKELRFCMGGPVSIPKKFMKANCPMDTGRDEARPEFAAVRWGNEVYVDKAKFNAVDPDGTINYDRQAWTVIHEAAHRYLDAFVTCRYPKLWSFIHTLHQASDGLVSREELHGNMTDNQILFSQIDQAADQNENAILFRLDSRADQVSTLEGDTNDQPIFKPVPETVSSELMPDDISNLQSHSAEQEYCGAMVTAMKNGKTDLLATLRNTPQNPLVCLLPHFVDFAQTVRDAVTNSPMFKNIWENIYEPFSAPFAAVDYRIESITADVPYAVRSDLSAELPTINSLTPIFSPDQLTPPLAAWVKLVEQMAEEKYLNQISDLALNLPSAKNAFELVEAKKQVELVNPVIDRDRTNVRVDLGKFEKSMKQSVVDAFKADVKNKTITPGIWNAIAPLLKNSEIFKDCNF
jgi:hypothetical protein